MKDILTKDERDSYLNSVTEEQKEFLNHHVRRGKKTIFANLMAKDKGIVLPEDTDSAEIEHLLEGWILIDYIDNGFVNEETPCECGRPLRYQYIVKHNVTNEIRTFGINHFEEHTGLPAEIVKDIKSGFLKIDYEMDELLLKLQQHWKLEDVIPFIPEDFTYPNDIEKHLAANVPLLDRQIHRLKQQIASIDRGYDIPRRDDDEVDETKRNLSHMDRFYEAQEPDPLNLFSEEEMPSPKNEKDLQAYVLPNEYRDAVIKYLEEGVTSARVICELLIKNNRAPNDRYYFSERPKIYVPVCFYLDLLVSRGKAAHIGARDLDDRYYQLV
ncbi:DUF3895 domain-containing protein [Salipaludibacillus daqingensis]|uniref:DUF3895 domain-containing protein n=1 Tax=Salipaludibacillus daqingensis TaxID=3041001 RepID=UPI002476C343|nr:DUF3895 domain-containing protein [Salipaludibacillus daqingensis]